MVMCLNVLVLLLWLQNVISFQEENNIDPSAYTYQPKWVYLCVKDEGCQRSAHPVLTNSNASVSSYHFDSVSMCRAVCGNHGSLWPKPTQASLNGQLVPIDPRYLKFDLNKAPAETRDLLMKMTKLTTQNLLAECGGTVTRETRNDVTVFITVESSNLELSWDTDESYALTIQTTKTSSNVHISTKTVYGARHALESLTQLIAADRPDFSNVQDCGLHMVSGARINDSPVFKHRGLLLDTSRHFIPMKNIKQQIDAMAAAKMNVFHWHVTDSHSFPLESSRVPQFTRYGAYSPDEIYSTEEVREFIAYAQVRGVRVMIELDSPAHAGNGWQWGKDYDLGDLALCVNAKQWRGRCVEPPCGQLNLANLNMYRVLTNLYRDVADLVPQPALLHMGGDELMFTCYEESNDITNYMNKKGFPLNEEGYLQLWAEFHNTALQIWDRVLNETGKRSGQPVVVWSSTLTNEDWIAKHLDKKRFVIAVWSNHEEQGHLKLLKLGYRVIYVPRNAWYLDHGFWGDTKYGSWRRMYETRLSDDTGNLLGGQVAMWSEYIDEQGLDARIWPRAASVAERLWSNPSTTADAAEPRLQRLRETLAARGLRPDVLAPAWCAQNAAKCI